MRKTCLAVAIAVLSGCQWNALAPGDACWVQYVQPTFHTDTVWNTVPRSSLPDSLQSQWRPYVLYQQQTGYADSVRVCGT